MVCGVRGMCCVGCFLLHDVVCGAVYIMGVLCGIRVPNNVW